MTETTYTQLSAYAGGFQFLFFNNQLLGDLVTIKASTNKISKERDGIKTITFQQKLKSIQGGKEFRA